MTTFTLKCPNCGAVADDPYETLRLADPSGVTDVITYCDDCDQEYAVEVYVSMLARALDEDELADLYRDQSDAEPALPDLDPGQQGVS